MKEKISDTELVELPKVDGEDEIVVNVGKGVEIFEQLRQSLEKNAIPTLEVHGGKEDVEVGKAFQEKFSLEEFFEDSERNTPEGFKLKKVGLLFQNLTVVGEGAAASSISDNLTPFKMMWPGNWFKPRKVGVNFDILHDINGFCRDGEMLLVIGRPGAGCSTLLRTIAGESEHYVETKGELNYGGISSKDFNKILGEACYIYEEDFHFPTLTLQQTLDFALKLRDPTKFRTGMPADEVRAHIRDSILKMFGLEKSAHTLVGNAFIRGLSGGERKRLTIAEAMISQATIECWDCTTRGLDSASALNYANSLKIITKTLRKTCIASFYQASDSIFDLFDRVLVLEKGRCIYFGPVSEAKQYFLDMGFDCEARKSTPDFLTGICNPQERKIRKGYEKKVPLTSFELEAAWKNSDLCKRMNSEIKKFKKEIEEENPYKDYTQIAKRWKATNVFRRTSRFSVGLRAQLGALMTRQTQIMRGNPAQYVSMMIGCLITGILFGTVFWNIPLNAAGGFARGGAILFSIFFMAGFNQVELTNVFDGRGVISKQKSYAFYHVGVYHLSKVVWDIPMAAFASLLFASVCYYMFGLNAPADRFFTFFAVLYVTSLCWTDAMRLAANVSKSMFVAQQILAVLYLVMVTYCGYMIPQNKMRPWLGWLQWIDPFTYAFKALFINEFSGLTFDCSDAGSIPYGTNYTDERYKSCSLPGNKPGKSVVQGDDYLEAVTGFDASKLAINVIAIVLIWVGIVIVNVLVTEFVDHVKGGFVKKIYKNGNAPAINTEEAELEQQQIVERAQNNLGSTLTLTGGIFSWSSLRYTVPVAKKDGGKRVLLSDVAGWIKPGQMTALMGCSGAGKTTLLDVLAQRKTQGKVEGKILLNGAPLRADFERITGYVEQMDVHEPYFTVREALQFSAKLRQESVITKEAKFEYVERVLEMMEMNSMGDALVGSLEDGVGISVEERKRLTIGMELVAKPHILFLDEPTSGLDAQSAYNIVKFIRKLSDAGMPLVCTIHQPSSVLFEYFDRLLLIGKGGHTLYFGDIGKNSETMIDYFVKQGARSCDPSENPAEYILEVTTPTPAETVLQVDWPAAWQKSPEKAAVDAELEDIQRHPSKPPKEKAREFATSYFRQTWELYKRLNLVWWRNPAYNFARVVQSIITALMLGFSFYQLGNSVSDMSLRLLAVFQFFFLSMQLMFAAQPVFIRQRDLFRRDYSSKFYSWAPFSVGMLLVDVPYLTLMSTLCVVIAYWTIGLESTNGNGFYFWILFVVLVLFDISFSQMICALSPNLPVAIVLLPLFFTFMQLFAGVVSPPQAMPKFWKSWMYHINPFRYFLEGMVTNVLHDVKLECTDEDLTKFDAPPGLTCGEYLKDFFDNGATGYITDANATSCEYCLYSTGSEWYAPMGWDYDYRWRNFGILFGFYIFNIVLCCLCVYVFRKQKR